MIKLKDYQERVLDSLREFFRLCAKQERPEAAFRSVLIGNGQPPVPYVPVRAAGLAPGLPYVCLRVPTGGGKTLMACHAAGLAMSDLLHAERAVVLWLVPSNTILEQTADALRAPRHPYRRALEMSCKGPVEVVTIEEALRLSRAAVEGQTVVIVSTIQAFRVKDTTGRKVYDHSNTHMVDHFEGKAHEVLKDLEFGANGKPQPSLVNMLKMRRPIVVVDEAHSARQPLSFETLGRVSPSCVVEFTATPEQEGANPSNVLHRVSAAELKAAEMVKLPLRVFTRDPGQRDELLAEAVTLRAVLERLAEREAQQTGEYLRPILLIQAERVDDCEPLRQRLVSNFNLQQGEIKISTTRVEDLKGVKDIDSPRCPVRFIITVEKLREGWDCPLAYVLCSLKATRSATAIEQIVGRVLRLPNARFKQRPELNCAYFFTVSDGGRVGPVLAELTAALEHNGFTRAEAERIIIPVPRVLPLGVQPQTVQFGPDAGFDAGLAASQPAVLDGKVLIDAAKGEITVLVPLDERETEALAACVKTPGAKAQVEQAVGLVREAEMAFGGSGRTRAPSAYERRLDFLVPLLCVREDGELFEFEKTFLIEHPWKLSEKDASLSPDYNPLRRPAAQQGVLDVAATGRVETAVQMPAPENDFVGTLHRHVLALGAADGWTLESLVAWLDRQIEHRDIPAGESAEFLRRVLRGLTARFGIADVGTLALDRFRLRDEIEARINQHRDGERRAVFQRLLLADSPLTVSDERSINFKTMSYEPSWLYDGGFQFRKHYFGPKPGELTDERRADNSLPEEFQCAQFIDALPRVKFWVRNLAHKATSFRLQTSGDWFYPDFICQLEDGRVLAVEYKGRHLWADAEEKRLVGAVWAARSNNRCLFAMPTAGDFSDIARAVKSH